MCCAWCVAPSLTRPPAHDAGRASDSQTLHSHLICTTLAFPALQWQSWWGLLEGWRAEKKLPYLGG